MPRPADSPGIVVPPPIIFLLGFLVGMGLDALLGLPRFVTPGYTGPALILLGAAVGFWGALTFLRHGTGILPHHRATLIVSNGPYRFSRNPMYLGLAVVFLGVATMLGRIGPLLTLLPTLAALQYLVVAREERYLAAKFQAEYDAYRGRVRRWL